jgi:pyruvate/2-oxoglutarate dehydrogenase complex dihydrolipoamide dehydrogenase (E3) component
LVSKAREVSGEIMLTVNDLELKGDQLLVAVGRTATVNELDLDRAGINYSLAGIPVDKYLRTNRSHIFAAGDCVAGNHQFTHVAGWQAVQAARNALLPLNDAGFSSVVPSTTFTDPEVAQVGLTEAAAREKLGDVVRIALWPIDRIDRAVTDHDREGFIKVVYREKGVVLGATIVAARAGEMITEFALAMKNDLRLIDLANTLHVYPAYSIANMQLAGDVAVQSILDSLPGKILLRWAGLNQRKEQVNFAHKSR